MSRPDGDAKRHARELMQKAEREIVRDEKRREQQIRESRAEGSFFWSAINLDFFSAMIVSVAVSVLWFVAMPFITQFGFAIGVRPIARIILGLGVSLTIGLAVSIFRSVYSGNLSKKFRLASPGTGAAKFGRGLLAITAVLLINVAPVVIALIMWWHTDPGDPGARLLASKKPAAPEVVDPQPADAKVPAKPAEFSKLQLLAKDPGRPIQVLHEGAYEPARGMGGSFNDLRHLVWPEVKLDDSIEQGERPPGTINGRLTNRILEFSTEWDVPADARPHSHNFEIADDFNKQVSTSFDGKQAPLPFVADGQGPFVVVPIAPRKRKKPPKKDRNGKVKTRYPKLPVYDLRTGEQTGDFPGQIPFWQTLKLSPNGKSLASSVTSFGNQDNKTISSQLQIWQTGKSRPIRNLDLAGEVHWFSFLDLRTILAVSGSESGWHIEKFDLAKGELTGSFFVDFEKEAIRNQPSGKGKIDVSPSASASARREKERRALLRRRLNLTSSSSEFPARLSPGARLLAVGVGKNILLVDLTRIKDDSSSGLTLAGRIDCQVQQTIRSLAFSENGNQLAILSARNLLVADLPNKRLRDAFEIEPARTKGGLHFTAASPREFLVNVEYRNRIFAAKLETNSGKVRRSETQILKWQNQGPGLWIGSGADVKNRNDGKLEVFKAPASRSLFGSENQTAARSGQNELPPSLYFPSLGYLEPVSQWKVPEIKASTEQVPLSGRIQWSDDVLAWQSGFAARLFIERNQHIWQTIDLKTGQSSKPLVIEKSLNDPLIRRMHLSPDKLNYALSRDGEWLAAQMLKQPRFIAIHNRQTPYYLAWESARPVTLMAMAGEHLLIASDKYLDCLNVASKSPLYRIQLDFNGKRLKGCLPVGPDGDWFALPSKSGLQIVATATGKSLGSLRAPDAWNRYAVSPDGKFVALLSGVPALAGINRAKPELVVYSLADRTSKHFVPKLSGQLKTLAFDSHGLVTIAYENRKDVIVFDSKTKRVIGKSTLIKASPDGRLWHVAEKPGRKPGLATPLSFPDPAGESRIFMRDDRDSLAEPEPGSTANVVTMSVALDLLDPKGECNKVVMKALSEQKVMLGKGPYNLLIKANPGEDTGWKMKDEFDNEFPIPSVEVRFSLLDSNGDTVWDEVIQRTLDQTSKYKSLHSGSNRPTELLSTPFEILKNRPRDSIIQLLIRSVLEDEFPSLPFEYCNVYDHVIAGDQQVVVPLPLLSQQ